MKYKITFETVCCDRWCNHFMESCGMSTEYGVPIEINYTTTSKPTKRYIKKIIDKMNTTKTNSDSTYYYTDTKLKSIEKQD